MCNWDDNDNYVESLHMVWNKVSAELTSVIDLTYNNSTTQKKICVIHINCPRHFHMGGMGLGGL